MKSAHLPELYLCICLHLLDWLPTAGVTLLHYWSRHQQKVVCRSISVCIAEVAYFGQEVYLRSCKCTCGDSFTGVESCLCWKPARLFPKSKPP